MIHKKTALLGLAALILVCSTACQPKAKGLTLKEGVLMIGMEIGYPPMEYFDDTQTPQGFDVEMGKAIAEKLGLTAEFVDTGWDGIFAAVDTNRFDAIMSSVTITPDRLKAHNFSKPYIANTLAMVVLKDSPVTARSPQECTGLDVAYQQETTAHFYMQKIAEETGLNYSPRGYEKVMYCFDELKLGRVAVIVTDFLVALDYVGPDSPFEIVWTNTEAGEEDEVFGICMKKGNSALTDKINAALEELFADGTMQRISQEIFDRDLVTAALQNW
jgi:polar amino acid transport system substrate-binding protein